LCSTNDPYGKIFDIISTILYLIYSFKEEIRWRGKHSVTKNYNGLAQTARASTRDRKKPVGIAALPNLMMLNLSRQLAENYSRTRPPKR
jgi:hypothetical protein